MFRPIPIAGLLLLGGCSTTALISSSNPVKVDAAKWAQHDLPIELHGNLAHRSSAELAAILVPHTDAKSAQFYAAFGIPSAKSTSRRIVFYINAEAIPPSRALCSQPGDFRGGLQTHRFVDVTAALCQDQTVISEAQGYMRSTDPSPAEIERSFDRFMQELFDIIQPGADDPGRFSRQYVVN
jgi:hypothetical protein